MPGKRHRLYNRDILEPYFTQGVTIFILCLDTYTENLAINSLHRWPKFRLLGLMQV